MRTAILIPARDEADVLPRLFESLDRVEGPGIVVVVDNGSRDATAAVANERGAQVVSEPRPGYGQACLAGIDWLRADPPDALVFLDADDFEAVAQLERILAPVREDTADLVIGERQATGVGGVRWHARLGNRFVLWVMRVRYGSGVRDMGPFRAIRWSTLEAISLEDTNYGWYVQMQVRALRGGYRVIGIPVAFERRTVGSSKVSGSISASVRAGWVMLRTLTVEILRRAPDVLERTEDRSDALSRGPRERAGGASPAGARRRVEPRGPRSPPG